MNIEIGSPTLTEIISDPLKQSFNSVFDGVNSKVESLDLLGKYKRVHFEILINHVQEVKILGMQNPINLMDIYYPTVVSTDIRRRIYADEWKRINNKKVGASGADSVNSVLADKYIEENQRVVVLGGPGAGKTTLLKYLALAYSSESLFKKTKLKTHKIPAYIHLPSLSIDGSDIFSEISSSVVERTDLYAEDFYKRLLENGDLIVLFDSLDEVPSDSKKRVVDLVLSFSKKYPRAKVVLTCRTADYIQSLDGFSEVEVAKLSQEAISEIIFGWFKTSGKEKAEKLISLLKEDKSISKLTETPLLLGLLCIQYRNDLALPNRRSELYRRCVDALLRDWDASRNFRRTTQYSQLSDDRKEMIFETVAGATAEDQIEYEFPEAKAISAVSHAMSRLGLSVHEAKDILVEIESHHGIIEKCSVDLFQFSHGTMHEYFIARFIVSKRKELDWVKKKYDESSWGTVLMFICAIMPDPSLILEFLIKKSDTKNFKNYPALANKLNILLLLHRCLGMGVSVDQSMRIRVFRHIVDSQFAMMCELNKNQIYPYASIRKHGVRQISFFIGKPRDTLNNILVPFRALMNDIYFSTNSEYASILLEKCQEIYVNKNINFPNENDKYGVIGSLTCLLCPAFEKFPQEFIDYMYKFSNELRKYGRAESIRSVVLESIKLHHEINPKIQPDSSVLDE